MTNRNTRGNGDDGRSSRHDVTGIDRRQFLALTGATAGALAVGTGHAGADSQAVTDVPGFSCDRPQFTCGRQVRAGDGMVSTVDPIASGVAATVLREGGTAVDAAVAIQYVLTVTQPHGSGIGGGGFMIVYDADSGTVDIVNSRERASRNAEPEQFLDDDGDPIGFSERIQTGEAMGVPGTPMGLETALDLHGTRPRQRLITPAIKLARDGFTVDAFLAEQIASNTDKFNEAALEVFSDETGALYEEGDTMTNPDLAETLELIRRDGAEAFYEGPIATDLAAEIRRNAREPDRVVDEEDLAAYDVTLDDPVRGEWYDYEIVSQPPPSSGGAIVYYILKLFELLEGEQYDVRSPEKYHFLAEAQSLAWADRNEYLGDPEFVDVPLEGMLSEEYLASRAEMIELGSTAFDYQGGESSQPGEPGAFEPAGAPASAVQSGSTTHFSVVDQWGNAVSYTSTIEQFMGSGKVVPGRGFLINNELTDFSAIPDGPNMVEPNKRPLSSMSPTMVMEDGQPIFTAGSPGGIRIITATAHAILHGLVYDLEPLAAIEEPSIFKSTLPTVHWEDGVPEAARDQTDDWGLVWGDEPEVQGNVQVIEVDGDELIGAADPSRDGQATGFDRGGRGRPR
ncbi:gamma-glutamyltransferase [Natrononativus amylolyticus]|uniref:gamma-glutamyltransferase n=1 Tax=Natrononativus amylolyticus TaxID=2963434 RepID=UPI0020CDED28|nr:gamma-glutamyltransferase [Natrononativus amylolyticus]